jgi:hypothetical protein
MAKHADLTGSSIHTPFAWTYADATARGAAAGFVAGDVGKVAWQQDDDSLWVLTDDSPVTWAQMAGGGGGGGGGGAPTTAKYFVGAADGTLSAEQVVSGWLASADIHGAAGGGSVAREYDSGSAGLTWSPSTPATVDVNTTVLSHLYINWSNTTEYYGLEAFAPGSSDFAAIMKVAIGHANPSGNDFACGLTITDSSGATGNKVLLQFGSNWASQRSIIGAFTDNGGGSFPSVGSSWPVYGQEVYLKITRISGTWSFWWSDNGKTWQIIGTSSTSFTVAKIGYRLSATGSGPWTAAVDFLRTTV